MKKILRLIFITAVFMLTALFSLTAQAANKEVYRFADVAEYNGEVYAHSWMDSSFDDCLSGNVSVKWLPEKLEDQINSKRYNALIDFTIYNGKIYYRAGNPCGADDCIESIYVCDLDGSNNTLIADNADNHTNIYIVDNYLYYSSMRPYEDSGSPHPEADGGLYKVNLDDLSITALVEPSGVVSNGAKLHYCDGYHVYYAYTKARFLYDDNAESTCYVSDVNGYNTVEIPRSSMLFYTGYKEYIWGDRKYYIKDGFMYEESKSDGSVKEIYEISGTANIKCATNRYIYY
ncbi:MAG: DUF5050 domain-containing protein, partial [Eubacterium sp.]|nr:DUF5050 domain-containing protein [Eubacterium sp.]